MRRTLRSNLTLFLLIGVLLLAGAASPEQQLRQQERARAAHLSAAAAAQAAAQASTLAAERLAQARIAAAARLERSEEETAKLANAMAALAARRRAATALLARDAAAFALFLPLIERLTLYPAGTLLAAPGSPTENVEALLALRGIARQISRRVQILASEKARLEALAARMGALAPALERAQAKQAREEAALDRELIAARARQSAATTRAEAEAKAAAAAAARATDLKTLIARLAAAARRQAEAEAEIRLFRPPLLSAVLASPPPSGLRAPSPSPSAPGLRRIGADIPVVGRIARNFGSPTLAGPASGITYTTTPAAVVVSPCSGQVVFGQPFRDYGLLIIIDCDRNYDFVLAGMARLEAEVGQKLRRGEPVGVMPNWNPRLSGPPPALYVELRHAGSPIDPRSWLAGGG